MVKKMICVLFAAALLLVSAPRARAAEIGTIRISLDAGELPVTNGAVTLYHVGVETEDGYRITDTFGGGMVKAADATSPHLAQWLAETEDVYGSKHLLDVDGNTVYSNLGEGLYLVVQTERMDGFYPIHPVLIALSDEGQQDATVAPELRPIVVGDMPQTGQSIVPFLGVIGMALSGGGLLLCAMAGKKRT